MGRLARIIDWIDSRVDKPADQSVLMHPDRDGSSRMLDSDDPEQQAAAARTARRNRSRSRWRWPSGR